MPISTWDGYTVFVVFSTVFVATFFMYLATKRVHTLQRTNAEADAVVCQYKFTVLEKLLFLASFATVVAVVGMQMSNPDYEVYEYLYNYLYSKEYQLFRLEGVFEAISKFIYDTIGEFQVVVLVVSAITNFFMYSNVVYYALRTKVAPHHALFIYLCIYMLVSFGLLRQICAAAIVLFSVRYILRRQYVRYGLLTLLALGFHATAGISLLLFLFSAVNIKSKNLRWLLQAGIVVCFYGFAIFSQQILSAVGGLLGRTSYVDYYAVEDIGIGNIVYRIPIVLFLLLFMSVIREAPKYVKLFTALVLLEVFVCFTYYFIPMLGGRLQYYIIFGYAIVIPYCVTHMGRNITVSPVISGAFIYGYGLYYVINQLLTTEWITRYLMPIHFFEF